MLTTNLAESEQNVVYYVLYVSNGLSLAGASFIMISYLLFRETRTYGTTLIFWLSLSDFFMSLAWFPWDKNSQLCVVQASMIQFFELASYFWSFSISLSLFQVSI